jgi:hypothetical protein
MVHRGNDHLGAVCVVAAHLAERAWTVMDPGMPYVICDTDNTPVTPPRPNRSSPDTGPCPRRSAAGDAAARPGGRPLSKSSKAMSQALKAQRGDLPAGQSWPTNPNVKPAPSPLDNPNLHRESAETVRPAPDSGGDSNSSSQRRRI